MFVLFCEHIYLSIDEDRRRHGRAYTLVPEDVRAALPPPATKGVHVQVVTICGRFLEGEAEELVPMDGCPAATSGPGASRRR
jgi:hypothetical protein